MAFLSALFSLLARQLGSILQAVFGWSITALFGRLPRTKQIMLSAALLLSILWPLFVLGVFVPGAAAWVVAFIPLHEWLGNLTLRIVWIVLAVIVPPAVGIMTRAVAGSRERKGFWRAIVGGYPLALGFFVAFILTVFTVPIVKIASAMRGFAEEHVFLQPKPESYRKVLHELAAACVLAGGEPEVVDVPTRMSLATKVIQTLSRGVVSSIVTEDPQMVRSKNDLELYLYPGDLLVRGKPKIAARVRARLTETDVARWAWLVESPRAQEIQDELGRVLGLHAIQRMSALKKQAYDSDMPFEDWLTLDRLFRTSEDNMQRSHEPEPELPGPVTEPGLRESVEEALRDARDLVKLEVELAKEEAREEVREIAYAAIGFGFAAVFGILVLALVGVAIVIAFGGTVAAALVIALICLVAGGIAVAIGYALLPKHPLERTRRHVEVDIRELKEHAL